jgi:hypothetical protein
MVLCICIFDYNIENYTKSKLNCAGNTREKLKKVSSLLPNTNMAPVTPDNGLQQRRLHADSFNGFLLPLN